MKEDEHDMRQVDVLKHRNHNEYVDVHVEFHEAVLYAEHEEGENKCDAQHSIPIEIEVLLGIPEFSVFLLRKTHHFVTSSLFGWNLATHSHPFEPQPGVVFCDDVIEENEERDHPGCLDGQEGRIINMKAWESFLKT